MAPDVGNHDLDLTASAINVLANLAGRPRWVGPGLAPFPWQDTARRPPREDAAR